MRGRRPPLTAADRARRAERNSRRGRAPGSRPVAEVVGARRYRYGGWVVEVADGAISVARLDGRPARAHGGYARLPRRLRAEVAQAAREAGADDADGET